MDTADVFKDHFYLFTFPHWKLSTLLLSSSIIVPFVSYHCMSEVTCGWLSSLFMYFGFTTIRSEKEDRKKTGGMVIAFVENLPQFIITYLEIFLFRTSITFTQAGFPLITLMLIYIFAAPIFAVMLYNELFWDGKESEKDINGRTVQRKERDR